MTPAIPDFVRTITKPTACAKDPSLWQAKDPWRIEQARRRCNICPFQEACQEWAMARPEEVGIWGGLTRRQRQVRRGERVTEHDEYDQPPARTKCACGRFLAAGATGTHCKAHQGGVPILTPLLTATLEAMVDGAPLAVVQQRLGVSAHALISRLGMAYQRLGVNELHPTQRRAAAMEAAREAGLLSDVRGAAA